VSISDNYKDYIPILACPYLPLIKRAKKETGES